MIIRNTNFYSRNSFINNINSNQSKNNSQIANVVKKNVNQSPKDITDQKIKIMNAQLTNVENSEHQLKNGMSVLKEKELGLNKISDIGNQLKELSKQYKNSYSTEIDKSKIEDKAKDLLNNLEDLMNKNKTEENNIVGDKLLKLTDSEGNTNIIFSKGIDITLDFDKVNNTNITTTKDVNHFSSNVSVKTLLENPSIIEKRILNPVQTATKDINESKSIVYSSFIKEYSSAKDSIDELFKIGGMSKYIKDKKMNQQKSMYDEISKLYY
jgi:vacuolar-type H+-ATPase subunit I/STV1